MATLFVFVLIVACTISAFVATYAWNDVTVKVSRVLDVACIIIVILAVAAGASGAFEILMGLLFVTCSACAAHAASEFLRWYIFFDRKIEEEYNNWRIEEVTAVQSKMSTLGVLYNALKKLSNQQRDIINTWKACLDKEEEKSSMYKTLYYDCLPAYINSYKEIIGTDRLGMATRYANVIDLDRYSVDIHAANYAALSFILFVDNTPMCKYSTLEEAQTALADSVLQGVLEHRMVIRDIEGEIYPRRSDFVGWSSVGVGRDPLMEELFDSDVREVEPEDFEY